MKKVKINISGIHCASCATNVERSIKQLKGIKSVSVSVMTNKAIIECEDSLANEDLKNAISKGGYNVKGLEVV